MKRIGISLCAAAFLAAIPVSHYALANGNSNSVKICHFPDGAVEGIVIEVSGNGSAVSKHVTLHGDSTKYFIKKGGGCVADRPKPPGCTKEQAVKCKRRGGVLDPKTCKCIIKPPDGCSKDDYARCLKRGGVLDPKTCKCIIKQK